GRLMIQNRVDLSPEAPPVRHKHPGEEIIYVLEGALEYAIDGRPPKTYIAGEALMVPAEAVHSVRNVGTGNAAELATYIGAKGKPFILLAECALSYGSWSARGTSALFRVPAPGRLLRRIEPPSASTRSVRPTSPEPRAPSAPPTPSSPIDSTRLRSHCSSETSMRDACECFAALARASDATK